MYIMQNEQTVKKEALKKDSETVQTETEHRDSNQPSEVSESDYTKKNISHASRHKDESHSIVITDEISLICDYFCFLALVLVKSDDSPWD